MTESVEIKPQADPSRRPDFGGTVGAESRMDKLKGRQQEQCGHEPQSPAGVAIAVIDSADLVQFVGKDQGYQVAA
jgi:hypothetical protein